MSDLSNRKNQHFIYPDWPAPANVNALMTTRHGGVSQAPFGSMNLGSHVDDTPEDVAQNRALLKQSLELSDEPLWLNQVHGTEIADHTNNQPSDDADAVISRKPNEVCTIMTADCLPVLFCNTEGDVIAAAHAGWRGLQSGILEKCASEMNCDTGQVLVWLGAAIGPDVFEVGEEVRDAFLSVYKESESAFVLKDESQGKWLADIYYLARVHLAKAGVLKGNIYGGEFCTYSDETRFYSYRREARTGRMASLIWLT